MSKFEYDVVIIGGLGRVGLPLGIAFADKGLNVLLQDINKEHFEIVKKGQMPFVEYGADELLIKAQQNGLLHLTLDPSMVKHAKFVITAIGTPIDEFLNPKVGQFLKLFDDLAGYFTPEQTFIIRSTVYPGTCKQIEHVLKKNTNFPNAEWKLAYCPERIVQGYSIKELNEITQLVGATSAEGYREACELFSTLSPKVIKVPLEGAELSKLFCNAWRYIQFAVANQFFMISQELGMDYDQVRSAMVDGYPRAESLPKSGFSAGPCLLKDTMQLSAFNSNFLLGHAAMMVNEGLPSYLVSNLSKEINLSDQTVGILGMAFKPNVDDIRDSLSYKLAKILRFKGAQVLCSDEFVDDDTFVSKEDLIDQSSIIFIGTPHTNYKSLKVPEDKTIVDIWGINIGNTKSKPETPSSYTSTGLQREREY